MKLKRTVCIFSSLFMAFPLFAMSGCASNHETVLRIYNCEEYIDEGGEGSYNVDYGVGSDNSVLEDFEIWYLETYGEKVRVEYSTFGTNEDLYNQLKLGDSYDLICPSDYMIMKLAAENMLEPFTQDFFDKSNEKNYYINNVSPYIYNVFDSNTVTVTDENGEAERKWSEYSAGYMWGTTGLIYNPEKVNAEDLKTWNILLNPAYQNKVTTKDSVRDSYFVGLAILNEDKLFSLQEEYKNGEITKEEYNAQLTALMNDTSPETVNAVQNILLEMKENIYGFETDTGKNDMVTGKLYMNFAWSGDAVYAMDTAESPEGDAKPVYLNYFVPEECSNLWFDGWTMPKGANKKVAQAFINFLSQPKIAVRNMYYIGYTSVIAGEEVFEYVTETYGVEEGDEAEAVPYDVSYFFGEGAVIYTYEDQLFRQLYAQYPTAELMTRCAVMDYFSGEAGERINELWTQVKGEKLDAWAIIVICVFVVALTLFVVYIKFGSKIDVRRKPKKGYVKIDEKPIR